MFALTIVAATMSPLARSSYRARPTRTRVNCRSRMSSPRGRGEPPVGRAVPVRLASRAAASRADGRSVSSQSSYMKTPSPSASTGTVRARRMPCPFLPQAVPIAVEIRVVRCVVALLDEGGSPRQGPLRVAGGDQSSTASQSPDPLEDVPQGRRAPNHLEQSRTAGSTTRCWFRTSYASGSRCPLHRRSSVPCSAAYSHSASAGSRDPQQS